MLSKAEVREQIKELKDQLTADEKRLKSTGVLEQIKLLSAFKGAQNILCYWSLSDEVFTHTFVEECAKHKNIFLPVVLGEDLLIRQFTGLSHLKEGAFSILEPELSKQVEIQEIDLVIVPGVAFDVKGGRMGRGRGFYDRLLSNAHENLYKLGICYDFQIVEEVPKEKHDVLMNQVLFG